MVMGELALETEVLVIGSGSGGYAAAFRAADLGLDVTMVDTAVRPGGVCLFRGCIPSKTFLHMAQLLYDAKHAASLGLSFEPPRIDLAGLRQWKAGIIDRLADGLLRLAKSRGIQLIRGRATFESSDRVRIHEADVSHVRFKHAIIATGAHSVALPGTSFTPGGRIMDSAGALALADIPETLLIIGGGYTGLEMGCVYAALGSRVHLVEKTDSLLPGVDRDLVRPLRRRLDEIFESITLGSGISAMAENENDVSVTFEDSKADLPDTFSRVLVAIGRRPNSADLDLSNTAVEIDEHGFIKIDERQRTTEPHIFAIGDVAGNPMLAHKAMAEGKIAAEVIAGEPSAFDARAIPAVVYTDPQIAWAGLTQEEAKRRGQKVSVERFPWKVSGRALTLDAPEGLTKVIIDPDTQRILGVGIVGREVEGLIAEGVLAIEMGALAQDLALSIHAHPTLSETEAEAAEIFLGSATHILPRKKP
jgi:dihydrolipoamide dehydrogenase